MNEPILPQPLDNPAYLALLLQEQGEPATEIESLVPSLYQLKEWSPPALRPGQVQQLIARLEPLITHQPSPSPVRQALRTPHKHYFSAAWTLGLAQVNMLRFSFWVVSVVITLLGALAVLVGLPLDQSLILQALGPLLAYWGTVSTFRGVGIRTLEFELACPPSLVKLTLIRLALVLGYDLILGLGLNLVLLVWSQGGESFLALTLHWLMPLFLIVGLALLLSTRLKINLAATMAYLGWLSLLVVTSTSGTGFSNPLMFHLDFKVEIGLGLAGLILMGLALWRLPYSRSQWLPHS